MQSGQVAFGRIALRRFALFRRLCGLLGVGMGQRMAPFTLHWPPGIAGYRGGEVTGYNRLRREMGLRLLAGKTYGKGERLHLPVVSFGNEVVPDSPWVRW